MNFLARTCREPTAVGREESDTDREKNKSLTGARHVCFVVAKKPLVGSTWWRFWQPVPFPRCSSKPFPCCSCRLTPLWRAQSAGLIQSSPTVYDMGGGRQVRNRKKKGHEVPRGQMGRGAMRRRWALLAGLAGAARVPLDRRHTTRRSLRDSRRVLFDTVTLHMPLSECGIAKIAQQSPAGQHSKDRPKGRDRPDHAGPLVLRPLRLCRPCGGAVVAR